jgi:hypothetical protein
MRGFYCNNSIHCTVYLEQVHPLHYVFFLPVSLTGRISESVTLGPDSKSGTFQGPDTVKWIWQGHLFRSCSSKLFLMNELMPVSQKQPGSHGSLAVFCSCPSTFYHELEQHRPLPELGLPSLQTYEAKQTSIFYKLPSLRCYVTATANRLRQRRERMTKLYAISWQQQVQTGAYWTASLLNSSPKYLYPILTSTYCCQSF